ncbi:hypothetical protein FHG87_003189 [Trinorchestia longiramus]|nr:hypothetical protein FHG87_003189 [Trinorchestia longiramus]
MYEIVQGYSRDFKVKFGGDKSKVMVINGDETDRDKEWNIGEVKIGRTKEYKYLGCMLSEDGCARAKGEKVVKAMQWWGRLSSVTKYRANKYECVRGIWKYVTVPSITFGMNVMAWHGGDLEKLDMLQNRVGRLALGTPKWRAVEAIRGDLGWSLFSERMVKAVLNYKVRIERMENKRWVKQIFEWNLSESLWEKISWGHARKLKIQKTVRVRIGRAMDDWLLRGRRGRGMEWDCNKWKKEIEKLTKEYGVNKWKHSMNGKTTLIWYASKNVLRCEMFYDGSFGSQLLLAVRCKALSVNRRTWSGNEENTRLCLQCNRGVEETVEYLILESSKYEHERESLMDVVHEQYEEKRNARCVEEESGMRYLVGLDEECNRTVVDAMKDFLAHAWNKQQ